MERAPFVSIIIPTYNRAHLLPLTLDSFLAQDYPPGRYEIIVADNNSRDATREVVRRFLGSSPVPVSYLFEPRQGVHYARNAAAREARGEILYFTDDDMVAEPPLIGELVKLFELDPDIACATGKIIGRFEEPPPRWVRRHLINLYLSLTPEDTPEEVIVSETDLVYSCHEAVRRDAFFRCGGFNPENTAGVWIGDGETGLGVKLAQRGYKFAYTPRSVIHHMIPPSRTTLGYLVKRIGNQGYCDAYTAYRVHRDRGRLVAGLLWRNSAGALKTALLLAARLVLGKESWHFIPARIAYLHRRNLYDLRLLRDKEFRSMVEIDDWLAQG
jgi:glucosyl-dolichyl phosphate glucuronosyltransferase